MKKRLLLIEDDPDISYMVSFFLESEGYEVICHHNSDGYQQRLLQNKPDLVILDLNVAGFNGKIICNYIKNHPELKHIPIVLMSANINILEIKKECGADDIIRKPFDLDALINTVRRYVED